MDPVQGGLMSQPTSSLLFKISHQTAQVATGSQLAKAVAPVFVNVHSRICRALAL